MDRRDMLPENSFGSLLAEMERNVRELKQKQQHSGLSGLLGYFVQTDDTWDFTGNINSGSPSSFVGAGFEIVFTASGEQPFPIENVQLDIRFGGTGPSNKPTEQPSGFWGYVSGSNTAIMFSRNPEFDKSYSGNETIYRWTFDFEIAGNLDYYIKAYVSGSSDGEVEVNQLY